MKRLIFFRTACLLTAFFLANMAAAQCSICTKTASQLGAGPAEGLNSGILYLAAFPFAIMGYVGWRWWQNEKQVIKKEQGTQGN
ncbi:MAG TPA: hypothetical protein VG842_02200 [Sediminibacterium sp.]|nr:hypothetical protein [Sediminibacterium sp.]